jgi:tRNA threonylcarbamoyladenosine biosynthesis protein TsaB
MVKLSEGVRLCIETSGDNGSLALYNGPEKLIDEILWIKKKSGQELATYSLKSILEKNKLKPSDIKSIALSQGPGSFTGLRVGFNLAKVLCFSLKIPVLLVDSLMVLAHPMMSQEPAKPIFVFTNAFKNLLFVGCYRGFNTLIEPKPMTVDEARSLIKESVWALGNGLPMLRLNAPKSVESLLNVRPDLGSSGTALSVGAVSYSVSQLIEITDYKLLSPLYLRPSQAEENLALGVIRPAERT